MRKQKNRVNVNVNVDKDDNGLYKARNHSNNADTIEDNPNMYVDMPVDYKKTEQVDDVRVFNETTVVEHHMKNSVKLRNL